MKNRWEMHTIHPCNVIYNHTSLPDMEQSMNTAFSVSPQNSVSIVEDYTLLLPAPAKINTDYLASTFGMHSSCRLASKACGLYTTGQNATFNCSTTDGWPGPTKFAMDLMSSEQYLPDMWSNATDSKGKETIQKPFNFGFAKRFSLASGDLINSGEVVTDFHSGLSAVILCELAM